MKRKSTKDEGQSTKDEIQMEDASYSVDLSFVLCPSSLRSVFCPRSKTT